MSTDCRWLEKHLEGFFRESLSAGEMKQAHEHMESCQECRETAQQLDTVDPLVSRIFRQNLAIARTPRPARRLAPIYAAAAAALAIAVWVGVRTSEKPATPAPQVAQTAAVPAPAPAPAVEETPAVVKGNAPASLERAKPQPAPASNAASAAPAANAVTNASPFLVSDAAGYSRTLADFRNHVLIFGIWNSRDPRTIAAMQEVYETFGANSKVRILGVTNEAHAKPANGTFPVVYNEGSQLLGAKGVALLIVDGKGKVRFRGSLLDDPDALLKSVRSTLDTIGIR